MSPKLMHYFFISLSTLPLTTFSMEIPRTNKDRKKPIIINEMQSNLVRKHLRYALFAAARPTECSKDTNSTYLDDDHIQQMRKTIKTMFETYPDAISWTDDNQNSLLHACFIAPRSLWPQDYQGIINQKILKPIMNRVYFWSVSEKRGLESPRFCFSSKVY